MRKLYLAQNIWSMRGKFVVSDEQGKPVYRVVGSLFKFAKHFDILNLNGSVAATVTKAPISWLPRFDLTIDGRSVATIQKKWTLFKPRYELSAVGITVIGDFWNMNFELRRGNRLIGQVAKRWFSIGDKYELTVVAEEDDLLVVGLVLAIDYAKRQAAAAASVSASQS
ncbi:LURP-one-related/scramblase family protein [Lactiplantibacillus nangangensis]|uniref:LURP-one-related/scramblase family protein n=1 Tax=Lactiplantibacillus nangangensis TaxID=2559917 RepID=A0ABW1SK98_9LACO|nr:LURP-one-related family protein [Lactiplantibacillus nangangensis]